MVQFKVILAVETSCDDTSVAIVRHNGEVCAQVSANQDLEHAPYGGIVPEIASRNHTIQLLPLIESCLKKASMNLNDMDGFVVTNRPGLIGSLIVGLVTVKTLAQSLNKPFIGVNHLEGHLLAPFLRDQDYQPEYEFNEPAVALAVSGGHTSLYEVIQFGKYKVLGHTLDDAAGEVYDKFAKMLGLGFPGGPMVDRLAQQAETGKYQFPKALYNEQTLDMSFSGLKSAAHRLLSQLNPETIKLDTPRLCADFQQAVVDVLVYKLQNAAIKTGHKMAILTGGVSANSALRSKATTWAKKNNIKLLIPPLRYCTDNAAMIGYVGIQRLNRGESSDLKLGPSPQLLSGDFL